MGRRRATKTTLSQNMARTRLSYERTMKWCVTSAELEMQDLLQ